MNRTFLCCPPERTYLIGKIMAHKLRELASGQFLQEQSVVAELGAELGKVIDFTLSKLLLDQRIDPLLDPHDLRIDFLAIPAMLSDTHKISVPASDAQHVVMHRRERFCWFAQIAAGKELP